MLIVKNLTQILKPISGVILKLLFAYLTMALLRVHFIWYNTSIFGEITSPEIWDIIRGSLVFDSANVCYIFGLFIILATLPVSQALGSKLWLKRTVMWSYLVGYFVVLWTNLGDSVYFSFSRKRFSAEDFHFFENSNTGDIALTAMGEHWPLLVVIFATMVLAFFVYKRIDSLTQPRFRVPAPLYYSIRLIVFLLTLFLVISGMRGGFGRAVRPITLSNAGQYTVSAEKASIVLTNPFCLLRTLGNQSLEKMEFFDDSTALSHFNPVITLPQDSLFGSQKGKNLVILVLESFSSQHSKFLRPELYGDNSGFTPFLDSLMQQGYYYTRSYSNGQKSIEALPAILSSIPSLGSSFALTPAALSPVDGMGMYFAQNGYDTSFYNGSAEGSMGFAAYSRLAGIDIIKSRNDYEEDCGTSDFDGNWGIWDEEFLQYYAQDLTKQYKSTGKPFFSTLFTISSHHPFVLPERYKDSFHQLTDKLQPCVEYTDMSLRRFFKTASAQPWYDNTVFIIVADHDTGDFFGNRTAATKNQIIHFIYTPDGSLRGKHDKITQQINIKPTMYHLFGNDVPFFAFGRSDFHNPSPFTINTGMGIYQWMGEKQLMTLSDHQLRSAYNYHTDKNLEHNLKNTVDAPEYEQFKAFLQAYYISMKNKHFTVSKN